MAPRTRRTPRRKTAYNNDDEKKIQGDVLSGENLSLLKTFKNSILRFEVEGLGFNITEPHKINAGYDSSGSGYYISKNVMVTCHHVVENSMRVWVVKGNTKVQSSSHRNLSKCRPRSCRR